MEVIQSPDQMRRWALDHRSSSRSVGLVPTMGALHEGHLSLARASIARCDTTIASIFVNPTQFAPHEDLEKYPRTLDRDLELLASAGVAAVFVPETDAMYPNGFSTFVSPPDIAKTLEGEWRPTHFRGVTTIVAKLFLAAPATHAFFGRKDYQQWKVIEAMTRDLNIGIEIVACDIVREPDGLALSSRNRYLNESERQRALLLSKALADVQTAIDGGLRDTDELAQIMVQTLTGSDDQPGVDTIEYAVIVDAETLESMERLAPASAALIAARVGNTRLIDNHVFVTD